jgi:hypothetical protein
MTNFLLLNILQVLYRLGLFEIAKRGCSFQPLEGQGSVSGAIALDLPIVGRFKVLRLNTRGRYV